MEDWAEIRHLHASQGMSIRAIAKHLSIARDTVARALAADGPPKYVRAADPSRFDEFEPRVRELLAEFPLIPASVLAERVGWHGPRPLLARYTEYYTDEESLRLLVKPGISGWAQVNGRNASPWDERLGMDAWYVRNRSMLLDSRIVFMTLTRVLRKTGVVVDSTSEIRDFDDERRDRMRVT